MKRKLAVLTVAALVLAVLCPAGALAATFTIGTEPAQLEKAGTVTLNITMANDGSAPMENIFIGGPGVEYSADGKVIQPGESLYFPLKGVPISKDQIGQELVYTVTWQENGEMKSRDLTATVLLGNQVALEAKRTADKTQAPTGGIIKLTYTLKNTGSVPIKNISITDKEVLRGKKIASDITLEGGAQKEIVYEYTMGEQTIVSKPVITYTTDQSKQQKTYSIPELSLGMVNAKLVWEVTKGATTEQGTEFTILVTNNGNQTVKSIQVIDELGNKVNGSVFALAIGEKKTLTYSVAADQKRDVVFTISGVDATGEEYSDKSKVYEVRTYIDPNLMDLSIGTEIVSPLNSAGSISLRFTLNNAGSVTMTDVVLSEDTLGELARLDSIDPGTQTIEKTLNVGSPRQMVFTLSALDPSGNPHEYIEKLNAALPSALPSPTGSATAGVETLDEQAKTAGVPLTETLKTLAIIVADTRRDRGRSRWLYWERRIRRTLQLGTAAPPKWAWLPQRNGRREDRCSRISRRVRKERLRVSRPLSVPIRQGPPAPARRRSPAGGSYPKNRIAHLVLTAARPCRYRRSGSRMMLAMLRFRPCNPIRSGSRRKHAMLRFRRSGLSRSSPSSVRIPNCRVKGWVIRNNTACAASGRRTTINNSQKWETHFCEVHRAFSVLGSRNRSNCRAEKHFKVSFCTVQAPEWHIRVFIKEACAATPHNQPPAK